MTDLYSGNSNSDYEFEGFDPENSSIQCRSIHTDWCQTVADR